MDDVKEKSELESRKAEIEDKLARLRDAGHKQAFINEKLKACDTILTSTGQSRPFRVGRISVKELAAIEQKRLHNNPNFLIETEIAQLEKELTETKHFLKEYATPDSEVKR